MLLAVVGVLLGALLPLGVASAAPGGGKSQKGGGVTAVNPCPAGQTYFLFQYNDSNVVGLDKGCATQNDITKQTNPGLIATMLHVSCSDSFPNGIPVKSNLGDTNRRVVAYTIVKGSKSGKNAKTCGMGTPVPVGGIAGGALALTAGLGFVVYRQRKLRAGQLASI